MRINEHRKSLWPPPKTLVGTGQSGRIQIAWHSDARKIVSPLYQKKPVMDIFLTVIMPSSGSSIHITEEDVT